MFAFFFFFFFALPHLSFLPFSAFSSLPFLKTNQNSYADIINSERLSDSHSGFSSPTPSSALSLSAAALPVHQQQQQSSPGAIGLSPAVSPGLAGIGSATGKISSTTTTTATTGGLGSALYSPVTSPEGEGALSPSVPSDADAKDSTRKNSSLFEEGKDDSTGLLLGNRPPINSRTDTTSSIATERYTMPGQIPLQTPPVTQSNRTEEDEKDVTPTNSKIRKDHQQDEVGDNTDGMMMKESTSGSSWNMIEMGKALVGNAAGAVGSVLGVSGIGTELEDENEINKNQKR